MKVAERFTLVFMVALAYAFLVPPISGGASSVPVRMTVPKIVALSLADDGLLVSLRGEAIGEALRSDDGFVWVNVLDGGTAVGVHVRRADAEAIDGFGEWRRTGAIVEVVGTVNIACPEHEGDFDIHARDFRVVMDSVPREHPLRPWKIPAALAAGLTGSALLARLRYLRRRERMI